ncbi:LUD domain-containing protein [Streptomyces crystallinus]|uniref:LUD domain-containing protein n=1 Tax=Streptomyces crystallinus TaxID=68191 RepID=A0ABP3Q608_9ACTN
MSEKTITDEKPVTVLPADEAFAVPASARSLERAAEALRGNGFTVHIVETAADARELVTGLLPTDRAILASTSETLRLSGIQEDIDASGRFKSIRAEQADWDLRARRDEVRAARSAPDVVVGSVHAVTEDGRLVTGSASGSQLASYAYGAGQAVWVVGAQKVVADLDTALRRVETYSLPKEDVRAQRVMNQRSVLAKVLITSREVVPHRSTVVLVREPIGF